MVVRGRNDLDEEADCGRPGRSATQRQDGVWAGAVVGARFALSFDTV